jgi:hypothetical protein
MLFSSIAVQFRLVARVFLLGLFLSPIEQPIKNKVIKNKISIFINKLLLKELIVDFITIFYISFEI